jgi:biotin carboxylase
MGKERKYNIFIPALDDFNLRELNSLANSEQYIFHPLLTFDEIFGENPLPIQDVMEKSEEILRTFDGEIDGIAGFWDFPVTSIVPYLTDKLDLPGPSLKSALLLEHKYWSRLVQSQAIDMYPAFEAVNPFDENPREKMTLDYPFWLKPVKATASYLGFKISNDREFDEAIAKIREEIDCYAGPFNWLIERVELPGEYSRVDGYYCIAEEIISGVQCTVSGYTCGNDIRIYGVVDSINYSNGKSFFRYEYPSSLPRKVKRYVSESSKRIIDRSGFRDSPFNIEYFYDEAFNRIWTLEVNPRLSQSHSYLYRMVDGDSNFEIMIRLAMGQIPHFPHREGPYEVAGKFFLRHFQDGTVRRAPAEKEIEEYHRNNPYSRVDLQVKEGIRLSDLHRQDSYSYDLAHIFLGGRDRDELLDRYHNFLKYKFNIERT